MFKRFLVLCVLVSPACFGQFLDSRTLVKVMELSVGGQNAEDGTAVVWHPFQRKYYVTMAGEKDAPLFIFNEKGKRLDSLNAGADIRGLWYNPRLRVLEGNATDQLGWFSYTLNKKGLPTGLESKFDKTAVSDKQAVGAYFAPDHLILFFSGGMLNAYSAESGNFVDTYAMSEITSKSYAAFDRNAPVYNNLTILSTGEKGRDLGLINITKRCIELYDTRNQGLKYTLYVPAEQPLYGAFNAAYANGIFWLFDQKKKVWNGYQ